MAATTRATEHRTVAAELADLAEQSRAIRDQQRQLAEAEHADRVEIKALTEARRAAAITTARAGKPFDASTFDNRLAEIEARIASRDGAALKAGLAEIAAESQAVIERRRPELVEAALDRADLADETLAALADVLADLERDVASLRAAAALAVTGVEQGADGHTPLHPAAARLARRAYPWLVSRRVIALDPGGLHTTHDLVAELRQLVTGAQRLVRQRSSEASS